MEEWYLLVEIITNHAAADSSMQSPGSSNRSGIDPSELAHDTALGETTLASIFINSCIYPHFGLYGDGLLSVVRMKLSNYFSAISVTMEFDEV